MGQGQGYVGLERGKKIPSSLSRENRAMQSATFCPIPANSSNRAEVSSLLCFVSTQIYIIQIDTVLDYSIPTTLVAFYPKVALNRSAFLFQSSPNNLAAPRTLAAHLFVPRQPQQRQQLACLLGTTLARRQAIRALKLSSSLTTLAARLFVPKQPQQR